MRVIAMLVAMTALAVAKPRWQELPLPPAMPKANDTGFIAVNGVNMYYARYGKGRPVVLLHGGLGNTDHWAHQVSALATSFDVIAIDSRGQGRSTRTKVTPTYDLMAKDVLGVLDQLKVEKASFVGWSDGGEVALKLAIHDAARVDKIVVIGANYDARGSKRRSKTSTTFAAYNAKCRADYEALSKTPKHWNAMVSWLTPIWRKPMGFTKDQLRSIKAPTLIADGDHDEVIVMAQLEEMAKLIPNARLHVFRDASHFVLWQDPAAVNKVLVEFLK